MDDIDERLLLGERSTISINAHNLQLQEKENSFNTYATTKSVSQELLNTSNIQYQIGLIVGLFSIRDNSVGLKGFEITLIVLVAVSLTLQLIMSLMLALLAKTTTDKCTKKCSAKSINSIVTILSGLGLILNITITVVSVETTKGVVAQILLSK